MGGKRVWKKGETPFCEVDRIEIKKEKEGSIIVIHLTPRGEVELRRRDRKDRARAAYLKKHPPRNCGVDVQWLLFGPIITEPDGRRRPFFS